LPVANVMPAPQQSHLRSPVRSVGELTTRAATTAGARDPRRNCARRNMAGSMIGSTASFTHSLAGLVFCVLPSVRLK